jgi:hypothetical protein
MDTQNTQSDQASQLAAIQELLEKLIKAVCLNTAFSLGKHPDKEAIQKRSVLADELLQALDPLDWEISKSFFG